MMLAILAGLFGCAAQPSPMAHAKHFVMHDLSSLNPQYAIDVNGSIKSILPAFEAAYKMGADFKAAGMSENAALTRANYIRDPDNYNGEMKSTFSNNTTYVSNETLEPQQKKAFTDAIAATFLDGYYHR
ncbi:Exc2 family lipoprotein [Enterobacter huaxiensis]|uniref:Exc2 family lipoprotein n=1 Tax=Enterobacter huaxiensis TaxID=2494702 RepID=UPI0021761B84|nr:Exc2 family lipoprotein [Enterobacter huaxiensis]MCS5452558.1 Exc2 family lipoprotein [Enterobacter huaxiensis]